jgi:hypothetical protein
MAHQMSLASGWAISLFVFGLVGLAAAQFQWPWDNKQCTFI